MKKLVSAIISIVLLLSLATPCFATYYRTGRFESGSTYAKYSCDGIWDMATDIKLAAEGCQGSKSLGAKVQYYDFCDDEHPRQVKYFHLFSTYGYVISAGKGGDEPYKALRKYVYG